MLLSRNRMEDVRIEPSRRTEHGGAFRSSPSAGQSAALSLSSRPVSTACSLGRRFVKPVEVISVGRFTSAAHLTPTVAPSHPRCSSSCVADILSSFAATEGHRVNILNEPRLENLFKVSDVSIYPTQRTHYVFWTKRTVRPTARTQSDLLAVQHSPQLLRKPALSPSSFR